MSAEIISSSFRAIGRHDVSAGALLLGSGPRFVRDAFGPMLAFYAGWKLIGLGTGIIAGTLLALVAYAWERKHTRSGLAALFGLGIALVQGAAGIVSGSPIGYFAPTVIVSAAYGVVFLVSVMIGRPLAGVFALEAYPFPPAVSASPTFRRVFSRVSLVWALFLFLRSAIRLLTLLWSSVELFVLANLITGIPCTAAVMSWSLWYGVRGFRRSAEWGGAFDEQGAGEFTAPTDSAEAAEPGNGCNGDQNVGAAVSSSRKPKERSASMPTVKETFDHMPQRFNAEKAAGTDATIEYELSGEGGGTWHVVIKDTECAMHEGAAANPNVTLQVAVQDWLDIVEKKQSAQVLFMSGKLKIKGDMALAMKMGSFFRT